MRIRIFMAALVVGLASVTPALADEKDVVLVQVKNETKMPIFVTVDSGRIAKNVPPDAVKKKDGTPAPKGLIIQPGANKSFGFCLGLLDSPTLHAWKIDAAKKMLTEDKDYSNNTFKPTDYIKLPPKSEPALDLKFDGEFKKK